MSFIDLSFPLEELETLGNKWPEPATKRTKINVSTGRGQDRVLAPLPRRQNSKSVLSQRRHRLSTSSKHQYGKPSSANVSFGTVKRSNSKSKLSTATSKPTTSTSAPRPSTTKSCLPSFMKPLILKNYIHHLHMSDRSRLSLPSSPKLEPQRPRQEAPLMALQAENEDNASSPGSLTTNSFTSPSSADKFSTPSASIYDQLRSGPFRHLFDSIRVTEHERDMMEDLLGPGPSITFQDDTSILKRKVKEAEVDLNPDNFYNSDEGLLQKMFLWIGGGVNFDFGYGNPASTNADRDNDVHSSGLSPATEEDDENDTRPAGIIVYDYSALSVDDLFNLDEASAATGLNAA